MMDDRTTHTYPVAVLPANVSSIVRHDWTRAEVRALFDLSFPDLMFRAQTVHRAHFDPAQMQISTLLSIKTGGCPEDCAYCPQSASYDAGVKAEKLMSLDAVLRDARAAKEGGASRFCDLIVEPGAHANRIRGRQDRITQRCRLLSELPGEAPIRRRGPGVRAYSSVRPTTRKSMWIPVTVPLAARVRSSA